MKSFRRLLFIIITFLLLPTKTYAVNIKFFAPSVGTITPSYGISNPDETVVFTTTYTDRSGWKNIWYVNLLINTSINGANCFYGYYDQNTNKFYLRDDANRSWLGGYTPGSRDVIENSYVRLNCSGTTVSGFGTTLIVSWSITFKSSFTGAKGMYLYVRGDNNSYKGWTIKGKWIITNQKPSVGTITPSAGGSAPNNPVTITTTYIDPDGWLNIQYVYFLVNTSTAGTNCFYGYYNQNTNRLYLRNDANTGWLGGYRPGSANIIENFYARLNCTGTTISGLDTTLTVNWNIEFKSTFAGNKNTYLFIKDDANAYVGWTQVGTWIIDITPPVGNIIIINDNTTYTNNLQVTLTLSSTDPETGVTQMRFSNDNISWSTPEPYNTTKEWELSAGDGPKTVYSRFKNGAGLWSTAISDEIILDTTPPLNPSVTITGQDPAQSRSIILALHAEEATGMMVSDYPDFNNAVWETYVEEKPWLLPAGNGLKTVFAIFRDHLGNQTSPVSDNVTLETIDLVVDIEYPQDDSTVAEGVINVYGTATRGSHLELLVNDVSKGFVDSNDSITRTWTSFVDWNDFLKEGVDVLTRPGGVQLFSSSIYDDDFSGEGIDPKWAQLNVPVNSWGVQDGEFFINIGPFTDFGKAENAPHIYQLAPGGNYEVSVKVRAEPIVTNQKGGLIIFGDNGKLIRLVKSVQLEYGFLDASLYSPYGTNPLGYKKLAYDSSVVYFKIRKIGDRYHGYYSPDGVEYQKLDEINLSINNPKIAITAFCGIDKISPITYYFDSFKIANYLSNGIITSQPVRIDCTDFINMTWRDNIITTGLDANDDFSGPQINTYRWQINGNNVSIENQRLYFTATSYLTSNEKFFIDGDFDIQIDFLDYTANLPSREGGYYFSVFGSGGFNYHSGEGDRIIIGRITRNGENLYTRKVIIHGSSQEGVYAEVPTSDSSGKFRITRTDDTIHTYYYNGSDWSEFGPAAQWVDGYIFVNVEEFASISSPEEHCSFAVDNFQINSGDVIHLYQTDLQIYTRTGPNDGSENDFGDWEEWRLVTGNEQNVQIHSIPDTYIQIKAELSTDDPAATPILDEIGLNYNSSSLGGFRFNNIDLGQGLNQIVVSTITDEYNPGSDQVMVMFDNLPPQGPNISIDEGEFTLSRNINLTLHAEGASEMIISERPDFNEAQWQLFEEHITYELGPDYGIKTIFVKFRDTAMNETSVVNDSIVLKPIGGIPQDGDILWPGYLHDSAHSGRSVYTGVLIDTVQWSYNTNIGVYSSPVVDNNGRIYFGCDDGYLYSLSINGSLLWRCFVGATIRSTPAIASDGTIYVGADNNIFYTISPQGNIVNSYQTGGRIVSSPSISPDGMVFIGSLDGKLYAFNPNGTLRWFLQLGNREYSSPLYSSPAIGPDGTIYIGSTNNKLYAVNPVGSLRWFFSSGANIRLSPVIDQSDGSIYFVSTYYLFHLDSNGMLLWRFSFDNIIDSSPLIGPDGTIYVGSNQGRVYAVNSNGTSKWLYDTGIQSNIYGLSMDSRTTIYFGCDRYIYALDSQAKRIYWSYDTGGSIYTIPSIGIDGTVYIAGGGRLFSFGLDRPPEIANTLVQPSPFSPNGDGYKDSISFTADISEGSIWVLEIKNFGGELIRNFTGNGFRIEQDWDGLNEEGLLAGEGNYRYFINARDNKGLNASEVNGTITIDITPPQNPSFSINEGDTTNHVDIHLLLFAEGAIRMMISEDSNFNDASWIDYDTSAVFTLSPENGPKTIYVKFRDDAFNETAVLQAGITLNSTGPLNPQITIDQGDIINRREITLTLSAENATGMIISEDMNFSGAQWEGYRTSRPFTLTDNDGLKTIYVRFRDSGSRESGAVQDSIILDRIPININITNPPDGAVIE